MKGQEFDELVGDVPAEERERLRRTHELLLAAGPPAELPPALAQRGGSSEAAVRALPGKFPRRRLAVAIALAAALGLGSFGAGYLVAAGGEVGGFDQDFVVPMRGTPAAGEALASLAVGERDDAGNWPMELTLSGLRPLPEGGRYELLLTRRGRVVASCGSFLVSAANRKTVILLNAPYRLRQYTGWVIAAEGHRYRRLLRTNRV